MQAVTEIDKPQVQRAAFTRFDIEKDIPLPDGFGGKWVDTLRAMQPGDSFACPHEPNTQASVIRTAKRMNMKVVTRSVGKQLRVWRLA